MINMFETLIAIALMIDALLASGTPTHVEPTKEVLYSAAADLTPAYMDMGYEEIKPTITFENLKGNRGSVGVPFWQRLTVCGSSIAMSMKYRYPNYQFYGTPDMISILSHEMAHVYQGVLCGRKTVETDATLMNLTALASMPEDSVYHEALLWQLRELTIMRALEVKCDKTWMDKLSKQAQDLYLNTSCGEARNRHYYSQAIIDILEDEDGKIDAPAAPELDVTKVKEILER